MEVAWYELDWTYGWITAVFAGIGLIGLFWYAISTAKMARATERQGSVLSYPTISTLIHVRPTRDEPYSEIGTTVANTSQVHAYAKVKLKVVLHIAGTVQDVEFPVASPYDGTIWTIAARQEFNGHFSIEGLRARSLADGDTLTLEGTVESSAFGKQNDFQVNPPILYNWNDLKKVWVPGIPSVSM